MWHEGSGQSFCQHPQSVVYSTYLKTIGLIEVNPPSTYEKRTASRADYFDYILETTRLFIYPNG